MTTTLPSAAYRTISSWGITCSHRSNKLMRNNMFTQEQ